MPILILVRKINKIGVSKKYALAAKAAKGLMRQPQAMFVQSNYSRLTQPIIITPTQKVAKHL
jgi:hypothetical protein